MYASSFKSNINIFTKLIVIFFGITIIAVSCKKSSNKWIDVDPAFAKYVEAYTTGVISKTSSIRVQLSTEAATTHTVGQPVDDNIFELSPSVKGKATWVDARTIEFKPEKNLVPDQLYKVNFKLGKTTKVPSKFNELQFNFQTIKPSFKVTNDGLRSDGTKNKMFLNGSIITADVEDGKLVEKLLSVKQNAKSYNIVWQHNNNSKIHQYSINNIERSANGATPLLLKWDGDALDVKLKGEQPLEVPAVGDFKVLNIVPVNETQQYASIQLSDPIAIGQDLLGLVNISNEPDVSYSINGSEIKLYSDKPLEGNYTVNVNTGIKNNFGDNLPSGFTGNIIFENTKPSVKILGKGNILPTSGKLVLPFDAINLNAVDISIIKIFENNVPQFLQQNDLGGKEDLRRVAKPIVQKTLRLDDDKTLDLHTKQRFSLDIDKFLKTEPGAIYSVTIGFRPSYSLYSKTAVDTTANNENNEDEEGYEDEYSYNNTSGVDDDDAFWDNYDNYYPNGYNWERRDDPTSKSYYNKDRWATRNILASNIGLTAKRGGDKNLIVAVSSILSTEPLNSVELLVLDYQQQVIGKGSSSSDGFATIDIKQKPYLLIAKKGAERGYLKLDDGNALPLSRFDVSGEAIKNGIKGFIFGERGVWRPGDSLFINSIIADQTGNLPNDIPVEFSLFTPQGQLYKKILQTNAKDGFNVFKTTTDATSPTGNWLVQVKVGGAIFEKRLKIETVMPNRLKINIDFGKDAVLGNGSLNEGSLNSNWLFGTPAKNLKAKVEASLYARKTVFTNFKDFTFDNPTSNYNTQTKVIFDATLDENGHANIKPDFQVDGNAPGMLTASLLTKVFEPGGSFSIDNITMQYSPYKTYVGIKLPTGEKPFNYLLTGKQHTVDIANVDSKGNALSGAQDVEVQFYKIQWRWWWDEGSDNLSNFTQDNYNKLISKNDISLKNGKGNWSFKTGNNEWGRYLILVKDKVSGHITGTTFYVDEPGWQSRSGNDDQSAASMLSFSSDKTNYNVGDNIKLTIPSAKGGRMLVSIESGSKVLKTFWQETTQGQTTVNIKAEANMAPNVYANVSLLQPHAQTINDLPIRMYGAIPLFVSDKNTVLTPQISMPETVRPATNVSVTVSEKTGKEMTYCIAVVDDGLLDLTRFKTPDPHAAFFAREALGVKSFDLFDQVIGAWGGDLERILTIGGDEEAGPVKQKTANRFKPVVKYFGPFTIGSGQKQTQTFMMPNYIGSVRTMVVAAHKGSYGFAEKTVTVKKPLMIVTTLPRVLAPSEIIKVPVTVFAMERNIKNVSVRLQPNNYFDIIGNNTQTLVFEKTGEQVTYFDVRVKNITGIGKINVLATSGTEKATDEIELNVNNPNPTISNVQAITLAPNQTWNATIQPIGIASAGSSVIEISSIPAMNLQKRLNYLITYPHGCIEQTTSSVFPQLVLNQLTDLSDVQKAMIDKNVKAGIAKIQQFQRFDGGFGYWQGANESDDWGTSYAGNFLIEAQNNGYVVGDQLLNQWKQFQTGKANTWVPSTSNFYGGDLAQAYRLYTLALAKAPALGAMNRLKEFKYLSNEAKWRLAAAYKLAGQDNTALDLISGLPTSGTIVKQAGFTYGSSERDEALILETLTLLNKRSQAASMVNIIGGKLASDNWYSTQTTAYSLLAIAKYCGKNASGSKIIVNAVVDGKTNSINIASYLKQMPVALKQTGNTVSMVNKGNNQLYVRIITQGQPLTGDTTTKASNSAGLSMSVSYISQNGTAIDVSKLSQGTDFIAKITVKNTGVSGTYTQMALSTIFPAGWEILNPRMMDGESAFKSSFSTYQDVRDDRVYTYFNIKQGETLTYYVQLNAAYAGRYYAAGANCSAMYNNNITANSMGKWVEVLVSN
ncbi:alpha-2-macroglobulin [Ferruginibacter yonginensis]|uniref:Alpha-2-macroglobulin n=1 Tax=Ferruginibacter yonginensis TaxID=1310416 RepID=A0ABV8QV66_9BACT